MLSVVQHHDLCDDMTLITFEDGQVVFRDGAVGTEQACCCAEGECQNDNECCYCETVDFLIVCGSPAEQSCINNGGTVVPDGFDPTLCVCKDVPSVRSPDCDEDFCFSLYFGGPGYVQVTGYCCDNECFPDPCNPLP